MLDPLAGSFVVEVVPDSMADPSVAKEKDEKRNEEVCDGVENYVGWLAPAWLKDRIAH